MHAHHALLQTRPPDRQRYRIAALAHSITLPPACRPAAPVNRLQNDQHHMGIQHVRFVTLSFGSCASCHSAPHFAANTNSLLRSYVECVALLPQVRLLETRPRVLTSSIFPLLVFPHPSHSFSNTCASRQRLCDFNGCCNSAPDPHAAQSSERNRDHRSSRAIRCVPVLF